MDRKRQTTPWKTSLTLSLVLILIGYLGCYLALLVLPSSVRFPESLPPAQSEIHAKFIEINGEWTRYPDYQGLPKWYFAPVHYCDRTWLRPHLWSGSSPRNRELSFDWLSP